jgi:apolipoprotein N-acyltransferase
LRRLASLSAEATSAGHDRGKSHTRLLPAAGLLSRVPGRQRTEFDPADAASATIDAAPRALADLPAWKLVLIAALAGALSVLSMAPFFLWPIMFLTFPTLIWALDAVWLRDDDVSALGLFRKRLLRSAAIGWGFGFGYFLAGDYWIGYSFLVESVRYGAVMPFAMATFAAGLALFYAAAAALAAALWRRGYARILAFVLAFFSAEAARGYLFTGFPWNLFGEAVAANDAHMQMAAYIGIYGLTLAALFIFSAPAAAISVRGARLGRLWLPLFFAVAALAGSYQFGTNRLQETAGEVKGVRVRIVQPNVPQADKMKFENRKWIFERLLNLSRRGESGEDIANFTHVLWPETSMPLLFVFNGGIFSGEVKEALAALIPPDTSLIMGAERAEGTRSPENRYRLDRVFNSLFILGEGAEIKSVYDKVHLVPFGEYVPLKNVVNIALFGAFTDAWGGFDAGSVQAPIMSTDRAPDFLPLICYEIIFTGRHGNGAKRPSWMVNLTNDAWFGPSTGPYQHLHQARIRAVEEGLPVMRAANTGVSAVIDPFGRIVAQLDLGKAGALDQGLPAALPMTFYEKARLPLFIALFLFPLQFYLVMVAFTKVV